jgi:hypothetical protein
MELRWNFRKKERKEELANQNDRDSEAAEKMKGEAMKKVEKKWRQWSWKRRKKITDHWIRHSSDAYGKEWEAHLTRVRKERE